MTINTIVTKLKDSIEYILYNDGSTIEEAEYGMFKEFMRLTENKDRVIFRRNFTTESDRDFGSDEIKYRASVRFFVPIEDKEVFKGKSGLNKVYL